MQILKIFHFVLILHLILEKVTKFPVVKLSTSEAISKKPHGGGRKHFGAFGVNNPKQAGLFADWYGGGRADSAPLFNLCLNGPIDLEIGM